MVYNGYEKAAKELKSLGAVKKHKLIPKKYILYVGTLQPRKNVKTLILAFQKFHKENPEYKLAITGKKGWLYEEIFELAKQQSSQNDIVFTGFVNDDELHGLYRNAFCFVLPSFYEGFGIPLLEAMDRGLPVIAAGSSALPEIGEDACLYFDPHNPDTLVRLLNRVKNDEKLRKEMIEKGKKRIKDFSWKKSAEETLKVIKSAV